MSTLYANPFDTSASGFYFDSVESYEAMYAARLPVEEYEIDFIDGDEDGDSELFRALGIGQATIAVWFDGVADLERWERAALYWLADRYTDPADALAKVEDCPLFEGSAEDCVADYHEQAGEIPASLWPYIDFEAMARDWEINGDIDAFEFGGRSWVATDTHA